MTHHILSDFRKTQLTWLNESPADRTLNVQDGKIVRGYWHHGADSVIFSGRDYPEGWGDMDSDDQYEYAVSIIEERLDEA